MGVYSILHKPDLIIPPPSSEDSFPPPSLPPAGGSLRIYRRDVQSRVFEAIGLTEEEAQNKFGYLLDCFESGAPPHGGIAFGLDRLVMLLAGPFLTP